MSPVPASAIAIDDNPTNALTRRLRAHLQALAALRVPITYRDVAKAMLLSRFCRNSAMSPSMAARPTPIRKPTSRTGSLQTRLGL